jgi:hypothetical protein
MASFYDLYEIAKIVQEDVLKEDFNWSEDHSSKYETKRGDKDSWTGKHHVHVFYNGEKIGTISPNSTRNDKKQAGTRIVAHHGYVTKYSINYDQGKGPKFSVAQKYGHRNTKEALRYMAQHHQHHLQSSHK